MDTVLGGNILGNISPWVFYLMLAWTLPWKGFALWKAARRSHTKWFFFIFLLNTFGILDIIYIYFIARKYDVETVETTHETDSEVNK